MLQFALGIDFGTLSVRTLLVDIRTGEEIAQSECPYEHGVMDRSLPDGTVLPAGFALQDPADYLASLRSAMHDLLECSQISPKSIIGIGVDFTSSTVIPVKADRTPLCSLEKFKGEPHAYVKLWKHHGGEAESIRLEKVIRQRKEPWFELYGGKVSSEWMLPKIMETLDHAPEVYSETDRFMEALDWIVWNLTGDESRSACGAGYKIFYRHDTGYPTDSFFEELDPRIKNLVKEKLAGPIKQVGECAGFLTEESAELLGLLPGIPVGVGIIDAHASMLGGGISKPGTMMIIVGTSSCHMLLSEFEKGIPGVGGLVYEGILPGFYAYEAGQCCVGDHFKWFAENCVPENYAKEARLRKIGIQDLLTEKASAIGAGKSGLLALDWFNGVRTPLNDYNLNGMILGLNLRTKPEEIYRALIEATAFGTRWIIEQFEENGIHVENIVLSGGIPSKNRLLTQIYSDICKREIRVCGSAMASCRGAAILGIAAAGENGTGYSDLCSIVEKLGNKGNEIFIPDPEAAEIYEKLYHEYKTLCDYFAKGENDVMKRLNGLRN